MNFKCLLSFIAAPLWFALASGQEEWTIDRAVAVALESSPDAQAAARRIALAEAVLAEARSYRLPQIGLQSSYTQTDSPMMAFGSILNQRAFDFGLDFNRPGRIDNLNATATVGINLYAGGSVRAGQRAAASGLEAARLDAESERQKLIATVVDSYLSIRKTAEAMTTIDAGVRAYEAIVSNAQARFEAGQVLKADLLSLEVQLAQTREAQSQLRNHNALAQRAFLYAVGRDAGEGIVTIAADDATLARMEAPNTNDYSQRPELMALRERERAASQGVIAARAGRRPQVNGFASYQWDRGWETGSECDSWLAGVAVSFDVFNGGKTAAKERQAAAQLEMLRAGLRKAELGIGLEVEQARLGLELARERMAVTDLALAQAEESAKLSRARFQSGTLLAAEIIGVESRLIEARMRRAVALADERIAIVALRRAIGAPIVE